MEELWKNDLEGNVSDLDGGGNLQAEVPENGSYAAGFFGALGGAVIGSVVWALVLSVGYIASVTGYVIGWLAEKGYTLLKGKDGKGKLVILIIVTIIGVVLGTLGAPAIEIIKLINQGELDGAALSDIPELYGMVMSDSQVVQNIVKDGCLGLIFAFMGCFSFFANNKKSREIIK